MRSLQRGHTSSATGMRCPRFVAGVPAAFSALRRRGLACLLRILLLASIPAGEAEWSTSSPLCDDNSAAAAASSSSSSDSALPFAAPLRRPFGLAFFAVQARDFRDAAAVSNAIRCHSGVSCGTTSRRRRDTRDEDGFEAATSVSNADNAMPVSPALLPLLAAATAEAAALHRWLLTATLSESVFGLRTARGGMTLEERESTESRVVLRTRT